MTLYEIDKQIYDLLDPETGEIADYEAFEALQMAREQKIEGVALWVKNLTAEAEAIKAEETRLSDRRKATEAKAERLKEWLSRVLNGESFRTARCVCSYRKTQSVELEDDFCDWARLYASDLLTYSDPKPNKTKIKEALKAGRQLDGARIDEKLSFSVK